MTPRLLQERYAPFFRSGDQQVTGQVHKAVAALKAVPAPTYASWRGEAAEAQAREVERAACEAAEAPRANAADPRCPRRLKRRFVRLRLRTRRPSRRPMIAPMPTAAHRPANQARRRSRSGT